MLKRWVERAKKAYDNVSSHTHGNEPFSRILIFVGTVFLIVAVLFWVGSSFKLFDLLGYGYVLFGISMFFLHFGMIVNQGDTESKMFIMQSNALNIVGILSLPFHFSSWLFLVPGLFMAFFAYFVLKIPEARETQYLWGNILIGLGAYVTTLNGTYFQYVATATQVTGFALIGLTLYRQDYSNETRKYGKFDYYSFRILSIWGLVLLLSPLIWFPFLHSVYNGFSWLVEGMLLAYSVTKLYKGYWLVKNPEWVTNRRWEVEEKNGSA